MEALNYLLNNLLLFHRCFVGTVGNGAALLAFIHLQKACLMVRIETYSMRPRACFHIQVNWAGDEHTKVVQLWSFHQLKNVNEQATFQILVRIFRRVTAKSINGKTSTLQVHLWIWGHEDWPSPSFSSHLNPIHRCACSIEVLPYLQLTEPHHSVILQKFRNIWQHWTNKRQNRTVSLCLFVQNGQWTIFWQVHYSHSMDKPHSFSLESLKFHNRPFTPVFHDK